MGVLINLPTDRAYRIQTVELDGVRYRIHHYWNVRLSSWFMSLLDLDENRIAMGRRLSPGFFPIPQNVPGAPPGTFYVLGGIDPYVRGDLGNSIFLDYITAAELAAATLEEGEYTITIP